jgi:hypothetical protein
MAKKTTKPKESKKFKSRCERCNVKVKPKLHPCPYACEIDNDCSDHCNCCDSCQDECAADI